MIVIASLRVAFFAIVRLIAQVARGGGALGGVFLLAVQAKGHSRAEAAAARDAALCPRTGHPKAGAVLARAFLSFGHFSPEGAVGWVDGLEFFAGPVAA